MPLALEAAPVIDGELYFWKDGEDVLFDEACIHYAENKSDVTRLIGKRLKAKSRFACYAMKYAMPGACSTGYS